MDSSKKRSWGHRRLFLDVETELQALGQHIKTARERRRLTLTEVAKRMEMNPRVVSKIEKGDPTATFGAVLQLLSFYGLVRGLADFIAPEHDMQATLLEVRQRRLGQPRRKPSIDASEVDF
jgi:transcriptional regulator with XRE-family HTH domain